jgi:hypothetical protein
MAKKDELTPQQMHFAMLYATGEKSATECAKLAGYKSPSVASSRMLASDKIGGIVAEQKKFHLEKIGWNANKVVSKMAELHDRAVEDGAWTPAINALGKIANWLGMDNHNSTKHVTVDVAFEDLLQRTIDITPAQSNDVFISSDKKTSTEAGPENLS